MCRMSSRAAGAGASQQATGRHRSVGPRLGCVFIAVARCRASDGGRPSGRRRSGRGVRSRAWGRWRRTDGGGRSRRRANPRPRRSTACRGRRADGRAARLPETSVHRPGVEQREHGGVGPVRADLEAQAAGARVAALRFGEVYELAFRERGDRVAPVVAEGAADAQFEPMDGHAPPHAKAVRRADRLPRLFQRRVQAAHSSGASTPSRGGRSSARRPPEAQRRRESSWTAIRQGDRGSIGGLRPTRPWARGVSPACGLGGARRRRNR